MKLSCKRGFAVLLAVCLLLPLLPSGAQAAGTVVYDAADCSRFQRSAWDVAGAYYDVLNASPSYVDGDASTYYSRPASRVYPYDQGVLTDDTLHVMENMLNYLRRLAGCESLTSPMTQNDSLQCAALVRNFDFNHNVSDEYKPADMPQSLWDAGKGVDNNVLALYSSPMGSIISWVNEGYRLSSSSWGTVGHRMNLLDSRISKISLGYSCFVSIGVDEEYHNTAEVPFTAYPAPGPMPLELVYAQRSCWTLELNQAKLEAVSDSALEVTVRSAATGEAYVCTKDNGKLTFQTWSNEINFVQPSCENDFYESGSVYTVVVTGLKDKASGKDAELRYQVEFFSLPDYKDRPYNITLNVGPGGDAACTSSTAKEGDQITVAAYPDNGFLVSSITWTPEGGSAEDITQTRRFTMPAANVTIDVRFAAAPMYALSLEVGPNGTASLSKNPASAGQEIQVEAVPANTYEVDRITWTPEGGDPVDITESGRFTMPEAKVCVKVSFRHVNPFVDVSRKKYYYDAVLWAYYHDPQVTSGVNPDHFGPNKKCTREQIMTFIWNAMGAPAPESTENPFTDVKPKYYYNAILWAVENGVTGGLNPTVFGVKKPCTRAQVVTFLYTAAGKPAVQNTVNPFSDVKKSDYYYNAVLWAVENGITGGTSPSTFSPKRTCTRAQVVAFLYKTMTNPEIEFCAHSYRITEHTVPSCTKAEHETKVCTKCGYTVSRSIGAALGHDFQFTETVPCCTQTGYDLYTCSRCGATEKRNEQPALGHSFKFTETVLPTESSEGYDLYTCERCGATEKRNIKPKLYNMSQAMEIGNNILRSYGCTIDTSKTAENSAYSPADAVSATYISANGGQSKLNARVTEYVHSQINTLIAAGYENSLPGWPMRCYICYDYSTDKYMIYVFR